VEDFVRLLFWLLFAVGMQHFRWLCVGLLYLLSYAA
jgi:hypothetical protein